MPATFSRVRARVAIPLLLVIIVAVAITGYSFASASTPYSVESGDTLFDIAAKNGVDDEQLDLWVSQVVVLNSLTSADALTVGQKLTLPATVGGSASGSAGGGLNSGSTVSAGSTGSYTVKSGDTLYGIAANNGVTDVGSWVDSILSLNNLKSADMITEGDVLKLPGKPTASGTSGSSGGSGSVSTATIDYTVQAGDTLYDIAVKNGISEGDLGAWVTSVLKLNNLDSPDMLALGKALKVPSTKKITSGLSSSTGAVNTTSTVNYTVKSGDTLYDIAMRNGAKDASFSSWVDAVLSLNNLSSPDVLREGDTLKLPAVQGASSTSGGTSSGTSASQTSGAVSFGASTTYTVLAGETWNGIAKKLQVPDSQITAWIAEGQRLSHYGKDEKLTEGVVLLVPSPGSGSVASADTSSIPSTTPASKPPATKKTSNYLVKAGDTLSDIAGKYKPSSISGWIKDVLDLNSLSSADMLRIGQELVVPGEEPASSAQASATSSTPPSIPPSSANSTTNKPVTAPTTTVPPAAASSLVRASNGTCYYTVLATDSWDSIAKKLGVSDDKKADWIDGISALNGIKGAALPVGDAIRLLC